MVIPEKPSAGMALWLAVGSFALGLLVRWPLQPIMGTKLIWLTFYPFIMVAALTGGFATGTLTALLSAAFAVWGWSLLSPAPYVRDLADWVGVGVFLANSLLIAGVAEVLRRANRRSRDAQAQAEAANRAKSVFLAQMSHELRTPFQALMGFTGLLIGSPEATERQRELLSVVDRNARHLLDLINNVLDMSRIEAGATPLESRPVLIRELAADVVELLRYRAESKGMTLGLAFANDVPDRILGDGRKLRQILVNLVGNAVKFSDQGTVTVGLQTVGQGRLALWVQDEGPGIEPAEQESIFLPFRQLESEAAKEGTGLGLAIVKQFAEAMQGTVRVESGPAGGSRFTVEFPAAIPSATVVEAPRPSALLPCARLGQPPLRFLVVDDRPDNRLLLETLLATLGQEVRSASDGEQAIALYREWAPHLIWMDIRMPRMDGPTATARIRALPGGNDTKIIAVTASAFREELESYRGLGFDDVLTKPFPVERVPELLERWVGLRFEAREVVPTPAADEAPEFGPLTGDERRALLQALESLDPETIDGTVHQLQRRHPALAGSIRRSIEKLDYAGLRSRLLPFVAAETST